MNVQYVVQSNPTNFSVSGYEVEFDVTTNAVTFDISGVGPQGPQGPIGPAGVGIIIPQLYVNQPTIDVAAGTGWSAIGINNTSLSSTVKLPAIPAYGQIVTTLDGNMGAGDWPITLDGNGNNINDPNGVAGTYVIGQSGASITLIWLGAAWSFFP